VTAIDVRGFLNRGSRFATKLRWQLLTGNGVRAYNCALLQAAAAIKPDLVWLELPIQVSRSTVEALRRGGAMTLSHNVEYLGFRKYQYRHFLPAIGSYDVHVVTNELTAAILSRRGARRVIMTEFGYDPGLHRPVRLSADDCRRFASDAVFVGHWETSYERRVAALRRAGISVSVHGSNWNRALGLTDRRRIKPLFGEDYVKAVAAARICLGFVSGWNRSQATHRTFEIPAIGGFLFGQRTRQHAAYYLEGKEAEFFGSDDEVVDKARFYLAHEDARRTIAQAGHIRCVTSGYTIQQVTSRVLEELFGVRH
jgi:hypothetical protein